MPGPGPVIGPPVLNHTDLGGVHFTGSTYVFSTIWLTIGSDIRKYQAYPRIVGETGGKELPGTEGFQFHCHIPARFQRPSYSP